MRVVRQKPCLDRRQHSFGFLQHLPVVESQNREARLPERRGTPLICRRSFRLEVLTAIEFDHEISFDAGEVCDEGTDGMLAAELEAFEPAVAQVMPQQSFCIG